MDFLFPFLETFGFFGPTKFSVDGPGLRRAKEISGDFRKFWHSVSSWRSLDIAGDRGRSQEIAGGPSVHLVPRAPKKGSHRTQRNNKDKKKARRFQPTPHTPHPVPYVTGDESRVLRASLRKKIEPASVHSVRASAPAPALETRVLPVPPARTGSLSEPHAFRPSKLCSKWNALLLDRKSVV